jgi:hypothetical protein
MVTEGGERKRDLKHGSMSWSAYPTGFDTIAAAGLNSWDQHNASQPHPTLLNASSDLWEKQDCLPSLGLLHLLPPQVLAAC